MIARYPLIDTAQVTNIFKIGFRAVDMSKLVNDHIPNPASKCLRLSRAGEIRALDEDANQQDLNGMVPFLRYITVYKQCLIEAVNGLLKVSLHSSLG